MKNPLIAYYLRFETALEKVSGPHGAAAGVMLRFWGVYPFAMAFVVWTAMRYLLGIRLEYFAVAIVFGGLAAVSCSVIYAKRHK
ncbi:MAG: hypothetical protein AAFX45_02795 [Pseudomonadota bacterium]